MKTKTSKTGTRKANKATDTNETTSHEEATMKTIDEAPKPTKSTQPAPSAPADAPAPAPVVPGAPVDGAIPSEQAIAGAMSMLDEVIAVLGPYAAP